MDSFFGLDKPASHGDEEELLTTVYDNVELSIVRGILEGESIPYLTRERGSGSVVRVLTGYTMFGTDIFVPKDQLDRAAELLEAYFSKTGEGDAEFEDGDDMEIDDDEIEAAEALDDEE